MNRAALIADLKRDEGCVLHAYFDTENLITVGVGRLLDKKRGGGISMEEAEYLLSNDIDRVCKELDGRIPWWRGLTEPQQRSLCSMTFQLGIGGVLKFRSMLKALQDGNGLEAEKHALDSLWAKQTPERAKRVASGLR